MSFEMTKDEAFEGEPETISNMLDTEYENNHFGFHDTDRSESSDQ